MKLIDLAFAISLLIRIHPIALAKDFGVEGGNGVSNAAEILDRLNNQGVPDLEVILSYAMFPDRIAGVDDINPFGHIALQIQTADGPRVITVNQNAVSGRDPLFFQLSPFDYFYGVTPISNTLHGSHVGLAYARSSVGVQFPKLDTKSMQLLHEKISKLDAEHQRGGIQFCVKSRNCAHLSSEILEAAGIIDPGTARKFPMAVFEEVISKAAKQQDTQMVFYAKIKSDHKYTNENVPVPAHRIFTTILNLVGMNTMVRWPRDVREIRSSKGTATLELVHANNLSPVPDTCSRLWIVEFVRAYLRRSKN